MKLLHVCLCVCALLSSAEMFFKKIIIIMYQISLWNAPGDKTVQLIYILNFSLKHTDLKPWEGKKNMKKIKTSNIFVLIKLGKVPLSSQKQTYHSFTYFYPVKTGKNPVVDTHLCKYGRCNHKVTKKTPWLKFDWASFTSWKNKLLKCCGLFGK